MEEKLFAVAEALTGEEIKGIRNSLELTQREFAELVNVSIKTIERWESGERPIVGPVVTLVKILTDYPQFTETYRIPKKYIRCGYGICTNRKCVR